MFITKMIGKEDEGATPFKFWRSSVVEVTRFHWEKVWGMVCVKERKASSSKDLGRERQKCLPLALVEIFGTPLLPAHPPTRSARHEQQIIPTQDDYVVAAVLFEQEDSGHDTRDGTKELRALDNSSILFSFVSLTLASLSYGGE
jgi:hypothetical protein